MPLPLTALLGREADLQILRQWLARPGCTADHARRARRRRERPVWRWSWLASIADEGAARVVFVPLAAIRDPAFVASAIAEALGLSDVTAPDLPQTRARRVRRIGRRCWCSTISSRCWTRRRWSRIC